MDMSSEIWLPLSPEEVVERTTAGTSLAGAREPAPPQAANGAAESSARPAAQRDTKLICLTTAYGDTLWGLARLFGTTVRDIARINGIANPDRLFPGTRLYLRVPAGTPVAACERYTIRPGDTLSGIAARFGLDIDELARKNGLFDPDVIFAGDALAL